MNRRAVSVILGLFCAFCLALSACSPFASPPVQTPFLTPEAPATPSPAPTPEPVIAVFGAQDSSSFQEGVSSASKAGAYAVEFVSGGPDALSSYHPDGAAAAIVFWADETAVLPEANLPVYVFAASGQIVPDGLSHLSYAPAGAAGLALDCAVAYPPHLSPVRMIGLFSGQDSAAYALWKTESENGAIFAKREFFAQESEETLSVWLTDVFSRYFPGMLDAVFAENGELAVAAAEKIASLGRSDIEVFSAGTDADAGRALSPILVCAVGANHKIAGERCYEEAAKLLSGGAAETGVLLPEALWYQP